MKFAANNIAPSPAVQSHGLRFVALLWVCLTAALAGRGTPSSTVALHNDTLSFKVCTQGAVLTAMHFEGDKNADWLDHQLGHFLCFDRWGPVTKNEAARGIPFHGEARIATWTVRHASPLSAGLATTLPATHFDLKRSVSLAATGGAFRMVTDIANSTPARRSYNLVEHVTLGKLWHQRGTRLATNATHGALQLHLQPELETELTWPFASVGNRMIDLRGDFVVNDRFLVSLVFPDDTDWGWVCLYNEKSSELLGYLWRTADFPWLHLWWYMDQDAVVRRAIEPGTTGLHLTMPELLALPSRFGRPLVQWLEAGGSRKFSLWGFAAKLPVGAGRVTAVSLEGPDLQIEFEDNVSPLRLRVPSDTAASDTD